MNTSVLQDSKEKQMSMKLFLKMGLLSVIFVENLFPENMNVQDIWKLSMLNIPN